MKPVLQGYRHFIKQFGSLLMHALRRIQLHDLLLPLEFLPNNWPGIATYDLCHQIDRRTYSAPINIF